MGRLRHTILNDCRGAINDTQHNVKWYITTKLVFQKAAQPGVETVPPIYFKTTPVTTTTDGGRRQLEGHLQNAFDEILEKIETFTRNGSGWVLKAVLDVDLHLASYDPLRGSAHLLLPSKLRNSKSIVNIKNDDDKCALWCILAKLFPKHIQNNKKNLNTNPAAYREHEHEIDMTGVDFPLKIDDVGKVEKRNNLAINIFTLSSKMQVVPRRISEQYEVPKERIVDLLYLVNGTHSHYCLITNLAGLCGPQITTDHATRHICRRCLHFCKSEETLRSHLDICSRFNAQKTIFPEKDDKKGRDKIRFTKIEKQLPLPFYFVADFECILEKISTCSPDPTKSHTTPTHNHTPCGAAYKISCTDKRFHRQPEFFGPDDKSTKSIAERFLDSIQRDARDIREMLSHVVPMTPLTARQNAEHEAATACYLCKRDIPTDGTDNKVHDHDHLTGEYRGAAHNSCNLQFRIKPKSIQIPCFFHNLKNYDAHFLIAAAKPEHGEIKCIPSTTEKYISFTIGDVVFKDSFAFTQTSLEELVKNLKPENLVNLRKWYTTNYVNGDTHDNNSDSGSDSDDEEMTEDDMMFLDDGPVVPVHLDTNNIHDRQHVSDEEAPTAIAGPSGWKRDAMTMLTSSVHGVGMDDDDDDDVCCLEPPRQQRRRHAIDDDDSDDDGGDVDVILPSVRRDIVPIDNASTHRGDNCDDVEPDDDDDADEGVLVWPGSDDEDSDDDDDDAADGDTMPSFDYRHNPYTPPTLTNEQEAAINVDLELLSRKGVYPYEYMDSFDKFKEPLPNNISAFHSSLTGEDIEEEDFLHAHNVFEHFGMKTLQEYHDLYLYQDVFLLDDVLTAFREMCMKQYGLDPLHYYTAPGLTWDAGLKFTGVTLDLITDEDKFLFVESGLRGGVSMISHRHAKANHPTLQRAGYYDQADPIKRQILYLDANNLYGWAMSQYLPVSHFAWMTDKNIEKDVTEAWIRSLAPDQDVGYILEVDLKYPASIHAKHSEFPLAPERRRVTGAMLSPLQRSILRAQYQEENKHMKTPLTEQQIEDKIDAYESTDKLIPNLHDKTKYVIHYRNLQLYLSLGMQLKKVHRVLSFRQHDWLEPYISHNTACRASAENEFEKDFFKLMNNAMFGKTMENVRNRRLINLVTEEKQLKKLVAQPTYKSITVFTENLSAVERIKAQVVMNKPVYVGMCVLDLSKWLMYDFFYNDLKRLFPQSQLLFTDTDSLCFVVENCEPNVYVRMHEDRGRDGNYGSVAADLFDFSNYPKMHFCYSSTNEKVPGKMKDELGGNVLLEFIGLRAKAYSYLKWILFPNAKKKENLYDILEDKRLKGIKKYAVKWTIHFDHYKKCLFDGIAHLANMVMFRSVKHQVQTVQATKLAMTQFDDKRYLLDDGFSSVPYGYAP